ncbi:hypothetical protein [Thalassobaculum sp.]|uniref:hypothetical protein n=1 Tax=Thalassobaculum sp. TaxID=2022740 RepID=UPI0032EC3D06
MKTLKTVAAAGVIASTMALAPSGAHAQAPTASSFDGYRVVAITAGVIGGAVIATIATDGLIIPVYAYMTGGGAAAGGMGGGAAAGGVTGMTVEGVMMGNLVHVVRGSMRVLGAIGGGLYADSWYTGQ